MEGHHSVYHSMIARKMDIWGYEIDYPVLFFVFGVGQGEKRRAAPFVLHCGAPPPPRLKHIWMVMIAKRRIIRKEIKCWENTLFRIPSIENVCGFNDSVVSGRPRLISLKWVIL